MHKARFLIIYIADSLEFTFNSVRFNQACWKLKQIVFWDFSLSQALHNLRQKKRVLPDCDAPVFFWVLGKLRGGDT
jgi:hypothetical protein